MISNFEKEIFGKSVSLTKKKKIYAEISGSNFLLLNKKLIRSLDGITALYLSLLIEFYFNIKRKNSKVWHDGEGFFYISNKIVYKNLGFSDHIIRKSKKILMQKNILHIKKFGAPPREYFLINFSIIQQHLRIGEQIITGKIQDSKIQRSEINKKSIKNRTQKFRGHGLKNLEVKPQKFRGQYIFKKNNIKNNIKKIKILPPHSNRVMEADLFSSKNLLNKKYPYGEPYWDLYMKCWQYPNLPYNLIRTNPVNENTAHTGPETSKNKAIKSKYDPMLPENQIYISMGDKLASIIKKAGLLNPGTKKEKFWMEIRCMMDNDFSQKNKKERKSILCQVEETIDLYQKWIGKEFIQQAYSPTSFRKKWFDLRRNMINQEKRKDSPVPKNKFSSAEYDSSGLRFD